MTENFSAEKSRLESRITALETKVDELTAICHEIRQATVATQESCTRMDNHIHFVNGAYTSLRAPLDFIRNRFNGNAPALPPSVAENEV